MNTWVYFHIMQIIFVPGGQDFDGIIMNYANDEYIQLSNNEMFVNSRLAKRPRNESEISKNDIFANPRLTKRLRDKCRETKESLSFTAIEVNIHVNSWFNN